jgi:hypothetical protein
VVENVDLVAITNLAEGLAVNIEMSLVILEGAARPAELRLERQEIQRKH